MNRGIHLEVIMTAGYACFLLSVALILELAAQSTHRRAKLYRHRGFRFLQHLDVWECPVGEHLQRRETDDARRLVRYRARAEKCNTCVLKERCTDSDEGREVVHSTEDWMDTEVGRFHRGISLMLLGLAVLIVAVSWARHHQALESVILGSTFTGLMATLFLFTRSYWLSAFGRGETDADYSSLLPASPWSDAPDGFKDTNRLN